MEEPPKSIVVIGAGNLDRGDDGVGLVVARRVGERLPARVKTLELVGDPSSMLDSWQDADTVFIVDAIQSGGRPGEVYRFDRHEFSVSARNFWHSTHALSVAQVIELARSLGTLPASVVVYGIEGANFTLGQCLSPEVEAGAREATDRIIEEIRSGDDAVAS